VGDFTLTITEIGVMSIQIPDSDGKKLISWLSCSDLSVVRDPRQKEAFQSVRWQGCFPEIFAGSRPGTVAHQFPQVAVFWTIFLIANFISNPC